MTKAPSGPARLLPVGPAGALLDLRSYPAFIQHFGALPPVAPPKAGHPGPLIHELEKSGLRGRGGGWFPTARKAHAVVESAAARRAWSNGRRPVVVANAMEGEPASRKDAVLLQTSPHLVLDGIQALALMIGADQAFIAVHRNSAVVSLVERALAERSDRIAIELIQPPSRYVASEESALAHWAGDGIATPVSGDRPFMRGVSGRPTAVHNVETLAHIGLIARFGGDWFAEIGTPSAPGTALVSVGGAVTTPGVIEVATGLPVAEIIKRCNGFSGEVSGFLTGGYGGSWVATHALESADWSPESVSLAGGVIGAGILWALDSRNCPIRELERVASWMAGESAGQCGPCRFGLPAIASDLDALGGQSAAVGDLQRLNGRLPFVTQRGGCKHPDGVARFVSTGLHVFQEEVAHHLRGHCSATSVATSLPIPAGRSTPVPFPGRDFK
ncbi:MAG: NADH-ubiquinone oxidoreductase-F iron-sulfur binding region domain-containing protein [Actinomycetota bacterium]|nr:NADH-ubiquinone oxidoreductase-F iron-sulfur binding region domain-containing protein [Actinomycetota bacterium]